MLHVLKYASRFYMYTLWCTCISCYEMSVVVVVVVVSGMQLEIV